MNIQLKRFVFVAVAGVAALWGAVSRSPEVSATVAGLLGGQAAARAVEASAQAVGAPSGVGAGDGRFWTGIPSGDVIRRDHIGYSVGFSEQRLLPLWAAYRIQAVMDPKSAKRPDSFETDMALPAAARVDSSEYSRSGFDRGHMAPNWAISVSYGRDAQTETFLMSNIVPQRPTLNRDLWESLERIEANDYARRYGGVTTFTGPIFAETYGKIGRGGRIAVPSHFFKMIIRNTEKGPDVLAFIMPQDATGSGRDVLRQYLVSPGDIERATGISFFGDLPEDWKVYLRGLRHQDLW